MSASCFLAGGIAGAMNDHHRALLSPCVGVCALDDAGYCVGCHRSMDEIAGWLRLSDDERLRLIEHVLPAREARRA